MCVQRGSQRAREKNRTKYLFIYFFEKWSKNAQFKKEKKRAAFLLSWKNVG
jgi:hypothetical protein